jgi:hypothetical protein
MNKRTNSQSASDEMRHQYDFSKGKRTDHARRYEQGHEVRIERADGSVTVQHFTLEDGAVLLEPDVRAVFKNSSAVNQALRCLIPLMRPHAKIAG